MENTTHTLRFRGANRDTFEAIKAGIKKKETRAGTQRYQSITKGDTIRFVCGKEFFIKTVGGVRSFSSIRALLRYYRPAEINPKLKTEKELRAMYASFPDYPAKIKKHGIIALELK
jgi:ASC-1-like (ASCH) protein